MKNCIFQLAFRSCQILRDRKICDVRATLGLCTGAQASEGLGKELAQLEGAARAAMAASADFFPLGEAERQVANQVRHPTTTRNIYVYRG